ncbi:MAG: YfhO family protein [Lachnospiraceae bacterium]|nr:YfhO family protein [Lachnospiraceae bacterium]
MGKKAWNGKTKFFLAYTVLFILMVWIIFHYFWEEDRTFVWAQDGIKQHYRALSYYSKWLRELISRLFGARLGLPSYSFSIGYGSDILTTLHYYAIGDPLNLLCIFVPEQSMLYLYEFLILLRFYLAGIAFSCYCFYQGKAPYIKGSHANLGRDGMAGFSFPSVLVGTFLYIFCGYALYAGVRHPYFLNPMIYLPLLLTGVEKLWREKKPGLFIGSVFISSISNFYFFYMLAIFVALYAVIRLLFAKREISSLHETACKRVSSGREDFSHRYACFKSFFVEIFRLAGYALVGVAASAVILLPVILAFLSNSRLSSGYQFDFLYSIGYYARLFADMLTVGTPGKWTILGYVVLVVPSIFSLLLGIIEPIWMRRSGRGQQVDEPGDGDGKLVSRGALGAGFILLVLCLMLPMAGYAINGFAYVANRWSWAFSMLLAFIVVSEWEALLHTTKKRFMAVAGLTMSYAAVCVLLRKSAGVVGRANLKFSLGLLALCLAVLAVSCLYGRKDANGKKGHFPSFFTEYFLLFLTLINLCGLAYFRYSVDWGNYIKEFCTRSTFERTLATSEIGAVADISRDVKEFFRYTGHGLVQNATLGSGLCSTQFYWSLANGDIWEFFKEQDLTINSSFNYMGLDDRAALCALAGVRYYVVKKRADTVPYGYKEVELSGEFRKQYRVFENPLALPLGYTYENYILREEYEALPPLRKQEALLEGLVLPKDMEGVEGFEAVIPTTSALEIPHTKKRKEEDITLEGDCIVVKKKGAKLSLDFEGLAGCETYLLLGGLSYDWEGEEASQTMELRVTAQDDSGKKLEKTLTYKGESHAFYNGKQDYAVNLGYSNTKKISASIIFPRAGRYTIRQIEIVCQPFDHYEDAIENLRAEGMVETDKHDENLVAATNYVTGKISLSKPKILALSIPYSTGWKAYVDGKEQTLFPANTMYCALVLDQGEHEIELRYRTPGLVAGSMISLVGIVIWILCIKGRGGEGRR